VGSAAGEVSFEALEDGIIFQEPIQFTKFGFEVSLQLGHELKEVDGVIAIDDHTDFSMCVRLLHLQLTL
jgi:hypothetical protein